MSNTQPAPAGKQDSVVIRPGQMHEDCRPMHAGETLPWQFVATGPLDFNVHYHVGKDVFYPVEKPLAQEAGGVFAAKEAQEYCWMWTNRGVRDVVLRAKFGA